MSRRPDLNRRPIAYDAIALPTELLRRDGQNTMRTAFIQESI